MDQDSRSINVLQVTFYLDSDHPIFTIQSQTCVELQVPVYEIIRHSANTRHARLLELTKTIKALLLLFK